MYIIRFNLLFYFICLNILIIEIKLFISINEWNKIIILNIYHIIFKKKFFIISLRNFMRILVIIMDYNMKVQKTNEL